MENIRKHPIEEGRAKRYIKKTSKIKALRYSVTVQLAGICKKELNMR